jgi:hypothetical protein
MYTRQRYVQINTRLMKIEQDQREKRKRTKETKEDFVLKRTTLV